MRVRIMESGRYRVTAWLGVGRDDSRPVPADLGEVDVRLVPGAQPQKVTATVDPAAVQDALAKLAENPGGR